MPTTDQTKPFKSYDEQIALLRERGLIITDDVYARDVLKRMNYYRFSAYSLTLRENDRFFPEVTLQDMLFTRWNGQPFDPNAVTSWFPGFLASHDLPAVHFHSLRHTNASLLIAAHVPVTTVSGRLGHAKTSTTTDIYAGFIRSSDAAAADALTDVFGRIKEKTHA